ncbi:uncharacterized protein [Henckelia pumila]|uniref:uncharacterized protein isoform X1 n=1 Tax=Henckelia pumila TaxID=405737 RepID=UPI003C6E8361
MAAVYSLYIINKSGGLIFYKDYGSAGRMDTNDSLRLASLWHSMHAISQQLSPVSGCSGIELLQADTFDLHCFQSLTGVKTISPLLLLFASFIIFCKVDQCLFLWFMLLFGFWDLFFSCVSFRLWQIYGIGNCLVKQVLSNNIASKS